MAGKSLVVYRLLPATCTPGNDAWHLPAWDRLPKGRVDGKGPASLLWLDPGARYFWATGPPLLCTKPRGWVLGYGSCLVPLPSSLWGCCAGKGIMTSGHGLMARAARKLLEMAKGTYMSFLEVRGAGGLLPSRIRAALEMGVATVQVGLVSG